MTPMGEGFDFHVLVLIVHLSKDFKENANIFCDYIYNIYYFCVNECKFPNPLKQANITPPF